MTCGQKRFLLNDGQDSTIALLPPTGSPARSYSYDPDGNDTSTGTGRHSDVRWTGGVDLDDIPLYHFGHRFYNPQTARWTQPDPINQPTTDLTQVNLYTYAAGDPVNRIDPAGTDAISSRDHAARLRQAYSDRADNSPIKRVVDGLWRVTPAPVKRCAIVGGIAGAVFKSPTIAALGCGLGAISR